MGLLCLFYKGKRERAKENEMGQHYTAAHYARDLEVMIEADRQHLATARAQGDTQEAKRSRDAIKNSRSEQDKNKR
jgi:transcription initiation factor IIF auxiliary subunit